MNPKRLIEEWLPIKEIGVESRRENSTGHHPPPNRLHVWWARRPLTASRATILASLLPAWEGNDELLLGHFKDEDEYHDWFLRMLGIPIGQPGVDPVATAEAILRARDTGEDLGPNPYGYPRAFSRPLDPDDMEKLRSLLPESPVVMDPMAGGGSIPFESIRMGFHTIANELNPVASTVMEATLRYPLDHGHGLIDDIQKWSNKWGNLIEQEA